MKKNFTKYFLPKGLSLIELIIYMGILSVLLGVLSGVFGTVIDVQNESKSYSSVDQDGRYILAKLSYDFQSLNSATDSMSVPNSGTLILTFALPAKTYTYNLNGSNLMLTDSEGSNQLNSFDTSISHLSFQRIGNGGNSDTIRISFRITSKNNRQGGTGFKDFQTTLGMP
jgi:hypothetical protein